MLTRLCIRVSRELLNTTRCPYQKCESVQKTTKCQFSSLTHNLINSSLKKDCVFDIHKLSKSNGLYLIRYESTVNTTVKETVSNIDLSKPQTPEITEANSIVPENNLISEIPDIPTPISEEISQITEVLKYHANGEPTLESLGLGGYGPIGLVQWLYEFIHINCDLPWWLTIMSVSIFMKLALFPTSVSTQRNNAKMQTVLPNMISLQQKMTEARNAGNTQEAAVIAADLQELLKKNKVKLLPLSNFAKIGVHLPIFIALRGMSSKPVESLQYGGFLWIPDLTMPDPYYILPLCTSVTMYCVTLLIMQQSTVQNVPPLMKKLIKTIPIVSFVFSMNFPGTVLCHWVVTNLLTLIENEVLKLKAVKMYFNIPINKPNQMLQNISKKSNEKGFRQTFFEAWDNMKMSNRLANFEKADVMQFNQAAKGPLRKTYKYNPVNNLSRVGTRTPIKAMKK